MRTLTVISDECLPDPVPDYTLVVVERMNAAAEAGEHEELSLELGGPYWRVLRAWIDRGRFACRVEGPLETPRD